MKAALTIDQNCMAPAFAGVKLWIPTIADATGESRVLSTQGWHPLAWGGELRRLGIDLLICGGIDRATHSALLGHGIQVIPDATGSPADAFIAWQSGRLVPPDQWPPDPVGYARFLGGRGRNRNRAGGGGRGGPGRRHRGGRNI